jgi:Semialdehyde dehydrogenase, NAD binding domain
MKFVSSTLVALSVLASLPSGSEAFALQPLTSKSTTSFIPRRAIVSNNKSGLKYNNNKMPLKAPPSLSMSYSVAIVGATGAVGKEIRTCLEARNFPVSQLRIFGSSRSAGTSVETEKYGTIEVELFDVAKARQCDVVFLAVSGDFALEHAEAIAAGDDGAVVIDNSVRVT